MKLQSGKSLKNGEYRIEKVLGQGGFGITYLGMQVYLGRRVAIKEFFMSDYCNRDAATSVVSVPTENGKPIVERFRRKFIKEAQNIARLRFSQRQGEDGCHCRGASIEIHRSGCIGIGVCTLNEYASSRYKTCQYIARWQ